MKAIDGNWGFIGLFLERLFGGRVSDRGTSGTVAATAGSVAGAAESAGAGLAAGAEGSTTISSTNTVS